MFDHPSHFEPCSVVYIFQADRHGLNITFYRQKPFGTQVEQRFGIELDGTCGRYTPMTILNWRDGLFLLFFG